MTYYDLFLEDLNKGAQGVQINPNHYPMFKGKTLEQANELVKPYGMKIIKVQDHKFILPSMDTHKWVI